ncbi:hypothetical protein RJT34_15108 [Clitoria ternatea]|uniref:Uncharacterized protein n=1 Tax=Clitoria ternatea TaxID=43366 RepID=A0AAN9PN55_CLITE
MVKSFHNWGEVSPTLFISHYKRPSYGCFKLEPIIEEEPQRSQILPKGVFVSMPIVLSAFLYIFLFRGLLI